MEIKSVLELLSFAATVASLVLALGAIWLSIVFYRLSKDASNATNEAAKGIASSVERLEKLFDKLYSDTFSIVRETVTDMRKHMWPDEETPEQENALAEVEAKADVKIGEIKSAMENQLQNVLDGQRMAQVENEGLKKQMRVLLNRAILTSRKVEGEAREEALKENLLRMIRINAKMGRDLSIESIIMRLSDRFPARKTLDEIVKLKNDRIIELIPDILEPASRLRLRRVREEVLPVEIRDSSSPTES
jgi:hypothetical protein